MLTAIVCSPRLHRRSFRCKRYRRHFKTTEICSLLHLEIGLERHCRAGYGCGFRGVSSRTCHYNVCAVVVGSAWCQTGQFCRECTTCSTLCRKLYLVTQRCCCCSPLETDLRRGGSSSDKRARQSYLCRAWIYFSSGSNRCCGFFTPGAVAG